MIVLLGTDLFTHEHFFSIRHQKVPGPHQENPSPTRNNRTYKSNLEKESVISMHKTVKKMGQVVFLQVRKMLFCWSF